MTEFKYFIIAEDGRDTFWKAPVDNKGFITDVPQQISFFEYYHKDRSGKE